MKHLLQLVTICLMFSGYCSAGVVQEHFVENVARTERIEIESLEEDSFDYGTILTTEEPEEIKRIIESIEFEDPPRVYDEEGNEIISLTCFCVAEYTITFLDSEKRKSVYQVKHSIGAIIPPDPHGKDYASEISLTKRSAKKLKSIIQKAKRKAANQSAH